MTTTKREEGFYNYAMCLPLGNSEAAGVYIQKHLSSTVVVNIDLQYISGKSNFHT